MAVSYTWGSPEKDSSLAFYTSTGTALIKVTKTAWEAVNRLAPVSSLWVDQICINQDDKDEVNEQIAMMGDIYSRCWNCAIWLGAADEYTTEAFSFLRRLSLKIPDVEAIPIKLGKLLSLSHAKIRDLLKNRVWVRPIASCERSRLGARLRSAFAEFGTAGSGPFKKPFCLRQIRLLSSAVSSTRH